MEPISKKHLKIDKLQRKRHILNNHNIQVSNLIEDDKNKYPDPQNISIEYIDLQSQSKRAKQWWAIIDNTYFKAVKQKSILLTRDLTSQGKLVNFFSIQSELSSSFQNQEILQNYPKLGQNTLIHVLFQSSTPFFTQLISYSFVNYIQSFIKRVNRTTKDQQERAELSLDYNITSSVWKLGSIHQEKIVLEQQIQEVLKIGNLQFISNLLDQSLISKIIATKQIFEDQTFDEDIDIEVELWENQVRNQNSRNSILWNNIISSHNCQNDFSSIDFSQQVFQIKEELIHHTILRYFEHGTKDKTYSMIKALLDSLKLIKPTKTRDSTNKKFFQTDCKICFCSFNYDSNQVLYCDMCNTSFHLACYGLHQIPQDKQYFCDCCTAKIKEEKLRNVLIKKINCQICGKTNFPTKQIQGHFYHMTCLVIFNFIAIKDGKIQLKEGLSQQAILKKVIQSQLQCESCIFCAGNQGAETGKQLKCSHPGCEASMHPICAYIHGCLFSVKKNMKEKKLDVNILCNKHDYERDYIQQSYLRRYMCNFKNTSQKTLQSFKAEYETEIQSRKLKLETRTKESSCFPKLITDSKIVRRYITQRQQKNSEKNQEMESTETRKMLEKLIKMNI